MAIQMILWDCLEIKTGEKFTPKSNKNIFKKMSTNDQIIYTFERIIKNKIIFCECKP